MPPARRVPTIVGTECQIPGKRMRAYARGDAVPARLPRRPSSVVFALFTLALVLLAGSWVDTARRGGRAMAALERQRELAATLGLTDLALFTEARYTRHPSQADRHTPFQDHPLAFDHFPSGSLIPPPARLRRP